MRTTALTTLAVTAGIAQGQIEPITELQANRPYRGNLRDDANIDDSSTWAWFTVSLRAGDSVGVEVDRTVDALDSASAIWLGDATGTDFASFTNMFGDGDGFPLIASGDDEDDSATGGGPWGDPEYNFTVPETSVYTIAVTSFVSDPPPWSYEISVSWIPAPSSIALFGLSGVGIVRRHR